MLSLVEPCVSGAEQVWGVSDAGAARVRGVEAGGHRAGVRAVAIAPDDRTLLSLAGNAAKVRCLYLINSNVFADMVWRVVCMSERCVIPNIRFRMPAYTLGQAWNEKVWTCLLAINMTVPKSS